MRRSFRQFMKTQKVPCFFREEEAAPPIGAAPPSPENPETKTNQYHFSTLKRQLGIDDESFDAALEGGVIDFWKVPDFSSKWGYLVSGPCSVTVEKQQDGNYAVTFRLKEKKLMSPHSFFKPYKEGERPIQYEGPVEDQKEIMSVDDLQDAVAEPMKNGGVPAGGGMGMGGPPGGPGGAPPGGAPGGAPPPAPGGM